MTALLLVDDHQLVRLGLVSLLNAEHDLEVVAEAGSASEAIDVLKNPQLTVDVAIVDIAMPGQSGIALLSLLRAERPEIKVVMLSMHADEAYVVEALRNGAAGYVLKGAGAASIISAVRSVMAGERFLSGALTEKVIDGYLSRAGDELLAAQDASCQLSERERVVVGLLCDGHAKREVAKRLFISVRTVETHRANAMRKLDIHSQIALVRYAIRAGLVNADDASHTP
jgi:DNA-binding NarL/FixJ family response regulator